MKADRRLARKVYKIVSRRGDDDRTLPEFIQWLDEYLAGWGDEITLYPGRRAVIRAGVSALVELRWERDPSNGLPYINSFKVENPPGEVFSPLAQWWDFPLGDYWISLVFALHQGKPVSKEDAPRPAAGKRPPLGHYRRVLAEYDDLVREGHPSPISVLVDRYRTRPGTVKSWLHRGRKYLGEENSGKN